MDPKLSNLDPKLQDAYNRVMGAAPVGATPPTPSPNPIINAPNQPVMPPSTPDPAVAPPYSPYQDPSLDAMGNQTPPAPPPYQVGDPANVLNPTPFTPSDPGLAQPNTSFAPPVNSDPAVSMPVTDPMNNQAPPPTEPAPMSVPPSDTIPVPPPAPALDEQPPMPVEATPVTNPDPGQNPSIPVGGTTTVAFNASNSNKNIGTTPVKKGGLHLMPIIVGLGIVVLLVAYTFVWVIIFNVKVPFIPQL